ncbi:MAG: TetR/AcrR family transcriptional regulator [Pseudomonadota bacterium]
MKNRPGTGIYAKGSERVHEILYAAHNVLMRDGYERLTMRAVAHETGMTVGNLNYYYSNKSDLLRDLIEHIISQYLADFQSIQEESDRSPEAQLEALLRFIVDDLGTKETTFFFPELWALSNHDEYASESMHSLYRQARDVFEALIEQINPRLTKGQVKKLALIVSASLEGLTVFVGHEKPFARQRRSVGKVTIKGLLDLIRNVNGADFKL